VRHSFTSNTDATNDQAFGVCFCKGFLTKCVKCIAPGGHSAKYSCRRLGQSAGSVARHFQSGELTRNKPATHTPSFVLETHSAAFLVEKCYHGVTD